MKRFLFATLLSGALAAGTAQELNCTVNVIAPQISNLEATVIESLESSIR